jgi:hypothetical protein
VGAGRQYCGRPEGIRRQDDEGASEARVKTVWPAIVAQFGALKSIDERREGQVQGRQAVELILSFEKNTIVQRAVFDTNSPIVERALGHLPCEDTHVTAGVIEETA